MPEAPPRTHLRRRLGQIVQIVFVLDLIAMFGVSLIAWGLQEHIDRFIPGPVVASPSYWPIAPFLVAIWVCALVIAGAYQTSLFAAGFEEFRNLGTGSMLALGLVATLGYLTQTPHSRGLPLLMYIGGTPVLLVLRYAQRKALHARRGRGRLVNHVLAVGSPVAVAELQQVFARAPWTGYQIVGMCSDIEAVDPPVPLLGKIGDVSEVARDLRVETVLVAGGSVSSGSDLRRLGWDIEGLDVDLLVVPSLTDVAGPRVRFQYLAGLPLVHVREPQIAEAGGVVKRTFDVVVSAALLVVLSPLLLGVAIAIKMQDGGPVFYRQRRVGLDHDEFLMMKFRSMVVNADAKLADMTELNEYDDVLFKIRDDPRITPLGRFIRKYSIDELPQLFNVLKGEMSLVGPRPPLPAEVASYVEDAHRRLLVRPGMSGLWQVSGRSDLTWEESVRLDLYYVDNWSLIGDLAILLKTVRAVLVGEGAY